MPDGGLSGSGHKIGINHSIIPVVSLRGGIAGAGDGAVMSGTVGTVSDTATAAVLSSCKDAFTYSKLWVCRLSTADVCPTDSPVILETPESLSEASSAGGPVTVVLTVAVVWAGIRAFN